MTKYSALAHSQNELLPEDFAPIEHAKLSPEESIAIALELSQHVPGDFEGGRMERSSFVVSPERIEAAELQGSTPGELADDEFFATLTPEARLKFALSGSGSSSEAGPRDTARSIVRLTRDEAFRRSDK